MEKIKDLLIITFGLIIYLLMVHAISPILNSSLETLMFSAGAVGYVAGALSIILNLTTVSDIVEIVFGGR